MDYRSFGVAEFWVNDIVVVAVSGDLDMVTAPEVSESLQRAGGGESAALIVDLTGVTFFSLAGMNAVVDAHRNTPSLRRFAVIANGPATSRPMKLLGLDTVVALYRTLDEALVDLA